VREWTLLNLAGLWGLGDGVGIGLKRGVWAEGWGGVVGAAGLLD